MPTIRLAAAALGLTALAVGAAVAAEPSATIAVEGTAFVVRLPEGGSLAQEDLVGAELDVADEAGRPLTVRIDGFARDPQDPAGEVVLYRMTTPDGTGGWRELCNPDPAGERWAFPLAGTWAADGRHSASPDGLTVTCSSGGIGKCVRFGYKPWQSLPDGTSLWDHHQACVRMLRADYCGDGEPNTRDGTPIDMYDPAGIQKDEPGPGMSFEAGWDKDGAVCVARPRIPENVTLDQLERRCPDRLAGRTGIASCTDERARAAGALILNKS
jgi:hypothetical protein